jgi:hypothetical protein
MMEGQARTCPILPGSSHKTVVLTTQSCGDARTLCGVHFQSRPAASVKVTLYVTNNFIASRNLCASRGCPYWRSLLQQYQCLLK